MKLFLRPRRGLALRATLSAAAASLAAAPVSAGSPVVAPASAPTLAPHAMVAAADPRAVEAGLKVLRAGGSAIDAAVAVQAVLGLVEPQSSGLGGGAFMVWYDAKTRRVSTYDGRETAPAAATPQLFYGEDGKPLSYIDAILSGRSTGAPGAIAMLELAHRDHGRRPWRSLFDDGERLARDGFVVGGRLARAANAPWPQAQTPDATAYFTKPDGARVQKGDLMRNPAYAEALALIAANGSAGLLQGSVAHDLVARTHAGPRPGALSEADLAAYRPLRRTALCAPYRGYRVCGAPAPAGTVGVLEILGLLDRTDIASKSAADPAAWATFAQASRLGYADRDRYIGDPAFVSTPTAGLLDAAYLDGRAKAVATLGGAPVQPGAPPGAGVRAPDRTREPGGTSDLAIVDAQGNALSMTTTVESVFGSGRMTHGFFLNNQLTDFSFAPLTPDGAPAANAVAAGKRPRSSMAPVIVLDGQGRFVAALGSPGGNSIIAYVAKGLVGLLGWRMPLQAAFDLPNLVARGDVVSLEAGAPESTKAALVAAGLQVKADSGEESGLQGIVKRPGGYEGAADKRREGVARGW